jgi:hypothetical protein
MANRGKSWVNFLLLAGALFGAWQLFFAERSGQRRLVNQLWLERMPRNPRDMVHAALLLEHENRRVGVVGRGSHWRGHQDAFLWSLDGDQLRARFPQDDKRYRLQVTVRDCEGNAPRPFQLCLEARVGDQVLRFFSRKDWVVRPHADPLPPDIAPFAPAWSAAWDAADGLEVGDEGIELGGPGPFAAGE